MLFVSAASPHCRAQLTSLPDNWNYQSNGNCTNHCSQTVGTYAFAVIQYKDCWCTNLIPSQQVDIGKCRKECPGFGTEDCGDADNGLFVYIQGNGQPSGTAGGPSSSKATSTPAPVSSSVPPVSTKAPPPSQVVTVSTTRFVASQVLTRVTPALCV
jgi:cell wall integrity and stress response component